MSPDGHGRLLERELKRPRVANLVADNQGARLGVADQRLCGLDLVVPGPLVQELGDDNDIGLALEGVEFDRVVGQDVGLDKVALEGVAVTKQVVAHVGIAHDVDAVELVGGCAVVGQTAQVVADKGAHVEEGATLVYAAQDVAVGGKATELGSEPRAKPYTRVCADIPRLISLQGSKV